MVRRHLVITLRFSIITSARLVAIILHSRSLLLLSGHGILPGGMQNVQTLTKIQPAVPEMLRENPRVIILKR